MASEMFKAGVGLKCDVEEQTPIFIVGMPRSGTSLVEQILSSHSDVNGAGELDYIGRFGGEIFANHFDICSANLTNSGMNILTKFVKG